MPCNPFKIAQPDGTVISGIMCSRGRQPRRKCYQCEKPADRLCDGATENGKTCDRPMCWKHAVSPDLETDYCEDHKTAARQLSLLDEVSA